MRCGWRDEYIHLERPRPARRAIAGSHAGSDKSLLAGRQSASRATVWLAKLSKIPLSENRCPWVNEFGKFGVAHIHAGDICVFGSARPAAARPQSRHGPLLARAARPVLCASPSLFSIEARAGGVAERSKAHAWKVCIRETVSRVRIPLPPPDLSTLPHLGTRQNGRFSDLSHRNIDEIPQHGDEIVRRDPPLTHFNHPRRGG